MKQVLSYLSIAFITFLFSACGGNNGASTFMNTSSGLAYELLVVVEPGVWERPAGRALFDVLDTDVPGLPQPERSFKVMHTAPRNFNSTLKLIRNIIVVDIRDIYTKGGFSYAKDKYSAPQMILTIQAPDEATFAEFVEENTQTIIDFFTRAEMNRRIGVLAKKHNEYISTKVASMFDCNIWVSTELTSYKQGENFFWASTNTATGDQNFIIYSYPYTDKNTFTPEYIIHKRDSVVGANIPGSFEGSYMSTDSITVDTRVIDVHGDYTMEARGLWRMRGGDFMGGPFVSHTRLDRANQRIITAEIFIYSPDRLKRNFVRQMEASLYTLRLPNEVETAEIPVDLSEEE